VMQHEERPSTVDAGYAVADELDARLSPPYDAGGVALPDCRVADLTEALQPMLEAVVRLAGATAATVRLVSADGAAGALVATVGRSAISPATPWCAVCDEAVDPASECVRRHVCGTADQFVASTVTQVCRHVAVVPLEHRAHPVGTLALLFAAPCRLPAEMSLLLKAVGDLMGVTLENARLTRENLRMSLMHERQMMANEVHDSLAQALTFMRMRMSLLSDAIRQRVEFRYPELGRRRCADRCSQPREAITGGEAARHQQRHRETGHDQRRPCAQRAQPRVRQVSGRDDDECHGPSTLVARDDP